MDSLTGQTLKSYELLDRIGEGGFGAVYRAYQPIVERDVAIKIILPVYANHPDFVRRFEVEARLIARLEHPHIVPLYDYWREPDGAYLVMRWLTRSLRASLRRHGAWSPTNASRLLDQVALALATTHRRGVIHRDIKPDNILLDDDNNAYLADFGIAKVLRGLGSIHDADATRPGTILGSPSYMAPEQLKDDAITPQTDIYSLGLVMYEVLTGERAIPEERSTTGVILSHLQEPLPLLRERSPHLAPYDSVLQRATAKRPGERYPDVLAMASAFRLVMTGTPSDYDDDIVLIPPPKPVVVEDSPTIGIDEAIQRPTRDAAMLNPYKGLRAFEEADAHDFFGRDALIQHLLDEMQRPDPLARFLAIVGPSGSGKSSVVRAGLLPRLRQGAISGSDEWYYTDVLPSSQPLKSLEAALMGIARKPPAHLLEQLRADPRGLLWATETILTGTDGDLLLFIDQFEEIFTLSDDTDEGEHLLNLLYHAVVDPNSRLRVIVTLRADFMDRPLQYVPFGELMRQRTEFVLPLSPDEIERAIRSPAERVGLHVDTELLAAVVADVRDEPGALPLLQYAMTELFERRQRDRLSLTVYRDSGGVLGALARRAEEVFDGLPPDCQRTARQMFLRLITLGEGTEDTRRRVKRSELLSMAGSAEQLQSVLDEFGKHRLLTFDRDTETREPTIEIAHEALIREWTQLREWLENSRSDVRLQRQLATAITEWHNAERRKDFLLTGGRLAQFEEWVKQTDLALTAGEREFIDASIAERTRLEEVEQARLAHEAALERRSRQILRILAVGAVLAALVGFGLSAFAFYASRTAQQEREIAQNERQIAQERADQLAQLAAQLRLIALRGGVEAALDAENTELARSLAIEAVNTDNPTYEAQALLARAAYEPGTVRDLIGHNAPVLDIQFTPDGRTAVSTSFDKTAIVWDVATGTIRHQLVGHDNWVSAAAISPDGQTVLTGSTDHNLILWDIETGQEIRRFIGHDDWITNVVISPDGRYALSSSGNLLSLINPFQRLNDTSIIVWEIATGDIVRRIDGLEQPARGLAISPDGRTALTADLANMVTAWDIETGERAAQFVGHDNLLMTVAFTPDGRHAYSAGADTSVIEWDVDTGEIVRRLVGHTAAITDIALSADGRYAITGATDNVAFVWNLETGEIVRRLTGHPDQVAAVAFSPDGRYALTGGGKLFEAAAGGLFDSPIRLWDLVNGAVVQRYEPESITPQSGIAQVAFSQNGTDILTASPTALIRWNSATGEAITHAAIQVESNGQGIVNNMVFSPDERFALASDGVGDMTLWNMETGELVRRFSGHTLGVGDIDFSPDGHTALSASSDSSIVLWNVETGEELRRYRMSDESLIQVWSANFSPDGRLFASGGHEGSIIIWNAETDERILTFPVEHRAGVVRFAWSADASRIVSSSGDGMVIMWDVTTGNVIRRFAGHTGTVISVALSPDERYLLSGSADRTMILWDVETGESIYTYTQHRAAVISVAFSADGQYALSGSADGTAILWRLHPTVEMLRTWTEQNRTLPPLSCEERERYGLDSSICVEATAEPSGEAAT